MSAAERAVEERRRQGLPDHVEDPAALARMAAVLTSSEPSPRARESR